MTTSEIAAAVREGHADVLELWAAVRRFAHDRAYKWFRATNGRGGQTVQDLEQEAFLALLEALEGWDEKAGKFLTWYDLRLRAAFTAATAQRTKRDRLDPLESALSLDMPLLDGEDDLFTLADVVADPRAEQDIENLEEIERQESVRRVVNSLPEDQRRVIVLRFFHGLTREQMAQRLHLTKTRAATIEAKALRVLRHPSRSKNLRQYL